MSDWCTYSLFLTLILAANLLLHYHPWCSLNLFHHVVGKVAPLHIPLEKHNSYKAIRFGHVLSGSLPYPDSMSSYLLSREKYCFANNQAKEDFFQSFYNSADVIIMKIIIIIIIASLIMSLLSINIHHYDVALIYYSIKLVQTIIDNTNA